MVKEYAVPGIKLAACAAGIRYQNRNDLVLMLLPETATTAAVFTQNAFCAAPVTVAKNHLQVASARALLINSGNANAGTGDAGLHAAIDTCALVASAASISVAQVLPFSTGVIGEDLPVQPFADAMPELMSHLAEDNWQAVSEAIMTTDTRPKLVSRKIDCAGHSIVITGVAKGAGMICPNMATMLSYIATDAMVDKDVLQHMLSTAVAGSFNSITVDGDTSTNDACVLVASGHQKACQITSIASVEGQALLKGVTEVCLELATELVRDAEGATKLISIVVDTAQSEDEARQVAYTVAHSPLVKTALFASDPNWGRILAAVGRSGVSHLDVSKVQIWLDNVCIVRDGGRDAEYTEEAGQAVMDQAEITIRIALDRGDSATRVLTSDLSHDYVTINAEYRT